MYEFQQAPDFNINSINTSNNNVFAAAPSFNIKPVSNIELSDEQENFITLAGQGCNILVDACIGSGKTTSIQQLCNRFFDKKILYLTYNTLLKVDAKNKITAANTMVTNYHSFAKLVLSSANIECGVQELIATFVRRIADVEIPKFDILVIDEYQDIESDIATMLEYIVEANPGIQIIAVGDMEQKIYDKTSLDIKSFIDKFLGNYTRVTFTKCFRICDTLADRLSRVWNKPINGCNPNCQIDCMSYEQVVDFLAKTDASKILCLGARYGGLTLVLNTLERDYPDKFNKSTVYASIRDEDRSNFSLNNNAAIFTTFDSSKGLERPVCVVFDCTEEYWQSRVTKPNTKYEIIRNLFCVAMSRGKEHIIFAYGDDASPISDETLLNHVEECTEYEKPFDVSAMFDFKYQEDVDACYNMLNIERVDIGEESEIVIPAHDNLIDLSPCIGNFQEASFFSNYNIDEQIDYRAMHMTSAISTPRPATKNLKRLLLYLTTLETGQERYIKQVSVDFATDEITKALRKRLSLYLNRDEKVQVDGHMIFNYGTKEDIKIDAKCDVLRPDSVVELKFVSELEHTHFLQAAMYSLIYNRPYAILWNTRFNQMYKISVSNHDAFLKAVIKAITKDTVQFKTVSCMQPVIGNVLFRSVFYCS